MIDRDKGAVFIFEDGSSNNVTFVMDYQYRFDSGDNRTGTNTLFTDGTFVDSTGGGGGTWAYLPGNLQLRLKYKADLDARLIGNFHSTEVVSGNLRAIQDPSDKGKWAGKITTDNSGGTFRRDAFGDVSLAREKMTDQ